MTTIFPFWSYNLIRKPEKIEHDFQLSWTQVLSKSPAQWSKKEDPNRTPFADFVTNMDITAPAALVSLLSCWKQQPSTPLLTNCNMCWRRASPRNSMFPADRIELWSVLKRARGKRFRKPQQKNANVKKKKNRKAHCVKRHRETEAFRKPKARKQQLKRFTLREVNHAWKKLRDTGWLRLWAMWK